MKCQIITSLLVPAIAALAFAGEDPSAENAEFKSDVSAHQRGDAPIFALPSPSDYPIVLDAEADSPLARLVLPPLIQPLKLSIEPAFAAMPIDGALISVGDRLYGFEQAQEARNLVELDLTTGEILWREALPPSDADTLDLYLDADENGLPLLAATPPSLAPRAHLVPSPAASAPGLPEGRRLSLIEAVAFAPVSGRAVLLDVAVLQSADLEWGQDVDPASKLDSLVSRRIQAPISIQLIRRPIEPIAPGDALADPSNIGDAMPAIPGDQASRIRTLRSRELTVFSPRN